MATSEPVLEQFTQILDWLEAEPADDCVADLEALHGHLARLSAVAAEASDFATCLQKFDFRVLDISGRLKARLLNASVPLPQDLRRAAGMLVEVSLGMATLYVGLMENLPGHGRLPRMRRDASNAIAGRALTLVSEAFLMGCMGSMSEPPGLWRQAYSVLRHMDIAHPDSREEGAPGDASISPSMQFKRMVAVSVLQPASLTARELAWVFEYLEVLAGAVQLSSRPLQPESTMFWIAPDNDDAPVAFNRRAPNATEGILYFCAVPLCRRLAEQIEWLERRIADAEVVGLEREADLLESATSGLPLGLTPPETLSLLRRMRERWATPPSREHSRRQNRYSVQVCQGLRAIWAIHRGGRLSGHTSRWTVNNESPGGYAIMSVSGVVGVLSAGMVLALRHDDGQPWSICIVRWIRGDDSARVELGLQVVSHGCTAVSVAFRGSELRTTTPALLLPPLQGIRRNPAILAPAGTYSARRFLLVREGKHLYVAQGRVLTLDMQTANVELFQYEIDTYPI